MKYNLIVLLCLFLQTTYFMEKTEELPFNNVFTNISKGLRRDRIKYLIGMQKEIVAKNEFFVNVKEEPPSRSMSKEKSLKRSISTQKEYLKAKEEVLSAMLWGGKIIHEESIGDEQGEGIIYIEDMNLKNTEENFSLNEQSALQEKGKNNKKNRNRRKALKRKVEEKNQGEIKEILTGQKEDEIELKETFVLFNEEFFNIIKAKNFSKVLDWFIENKLPIKAIERLKNKLGDINKEKQVIIYNIIEKIFRLYDVKSPQSITIEKFLDIFNFRKKEEKEEEGKEDTLSIVKDVLNCYCDITLLEKKEAPLFSLKAPELMFVDVLVSGVLNEKDLKAIEGLLDEALQEKVLNKLKAIKGILYESLQWKKTLQEKEAEEKLFEKFSILFKHL